MSCNVYSEHREQLFQQTFRSVSHSTNSPILGMERFLTKTHKCWTILKSPFLAIIIIEPRHEKTCLCHTRTTKAQISLRIIREKEHQTHTKYPIQCPSPFSGLVSFCLSSQKWAGDNSIKSFILIEEWLRYISDWNHLHGFKVLMLSTFWVV